MNKLTGSKGCLATDTRSLREIAPLLKNYFGITLGYFENEIELSTGKHAAKAIQEDHEIRLPTNRFDYNAYMELFGETPLLTERLREALLFVAYIITDRKFNEEELYERGYWEDWNTYKGEWAKLMLFMEETEQRHRNLYERVGEQEMPVTLRTLHCLNRFLANARYDPKFFIMPGELIQHLDRVRKLGKVVTDLCKKRIALYEKRAQ